MSAEKPFEWPWEPEEFEHWAASVPWQNAVTKPLKPHQYTLKRRAPSRKQFELAVLHTREFGQQERFGGQEYTYYESAGYKYWTMMSPLEWTVLINRKELPKGS